MELYGRVAQLGEHLLCKHVFISPKSLNRRLLTVQTPLLVGLLNGLQTLIRVRCPSLDKERWTRFESSENYRKSDLGLLFRHRRMRPHSDNKLREKVIHPLLVSLKIYSPGKAFHSI